MCFLKGTAPVLVPFVVYKHHGFKNAKDLQRINFITSANIKKQSLPNKISFWYPMSHPNTDRWFVWVMLYSAEDLLVRCFLNPQMYIQYESLTTDYGCCILLGTIHLVCFECKGSPSQQTHKKKGTGKTKVRKDKQKTKDIQKDRMIIFIFISGNITSYNHQPTGVLNTAQLN